MSQNIHVVTTRFVFPRVCEAFDLFRELTSRFGMQSAFLLDSVKDIKNPHCTSIIGFRPIMGVTCKEKTFQLYGDSSVVDRIDHSLSDHRIQMPALNTPVSQLLDTIRETFHVSSEEKYPYSFGYLGYFGYDSIRYYENIPNTTFDDRNLPDVHLQVHEIVLQFEQDHIYLFHNQFEGIDVTPIEDIIQLLHPYEKPEFVGYDPAQLRVEEDVTREEFIERVHKAKDYIGQGDIFQVVLSKRDRVIGPIDPLEIYYRLKQVNPSPYMYFIDYGDYRIFGASPEVQVRLENGKAQMRPIAGTTKGKGKTPEENQVLIDDLLNDQKERAEHLMLVDLCRNDLGRVAVQGTVQVPELMVIEEYSHVFHIVSLVEAEIPDDQSRFEVFLSTFPAGTLSGAPKIRAMEIIDELETLQRGPYGGVLGFIDFYGNMNSAIVIRTVVHQGDTCYMQAGAGIVADSIPEQEWNECNHKLRVLQSTLFANQSV